ncbi:MAG: ABC-F family ATP-binding cassette domain-containing protein [Bacteroidetes bacterium]|nr:ABC-F family ATP-binding cassette domain-containing protein [Bacteroidota bacterium]
MISINNISVQFGGVPLFDHVSFIINDKDRIGLVGKNGAGKSTLLKIIDGIQRPDEGEVVVPSGSTIGYLPQEMNTDSTRSVMEETMTAFKEILSLQEKIIHLEEEIKSRTDYESASYHDLMKHHTEAYDRFLLLEGQSIHINSEKVLTGLGFTVEEFSRPMNEFSSGWQMRVEIAKILLRQPDVVLLDEPTNHLDIESIQWLEEFLTDYRGAVILVSHDRAFLDNVTKRTVDISLGKLYDYRANYSGYVTLREERLESQIATYNNQQRQIRQIERFVERFRYKSTKAKQVQSRIKMLEKIEEVELDLMDESSIHFRFPPAPHSGKIILEGKHLSKQYPQKKVLNDLNFSIIKNDKIAFVGKNGEGKTTLAKIIARILEFDGDLKYGHNVVIGYYAQDQSDHLDPDKTVFKTIDDIATGDIRPRIRTILGGFLFSGDTIEKKVKVLSGGEKSRLALARLLLTPSNLLILDEPTNHLDMHSKDILKMALLQYTGTLIIVSHDRDFLQGLTNRIFEFREGTMREYLGDIYDFLEVRRLRTLSQLEADQKKNDRQNKTEEVVSTNKLSWEKRKNFDKDLRKIKNQVSKCEEEIEKLERAMKLHEDVLGDPQKHWEVMKSGKVYEEYEQLKKQHTIEMKRWEELHNELEILEKLKDF